LSTDHGVEGRLYFRAEGPGEKTKHVIFLVNARNSTQSHVSGLRGVLDREMAEVGVLISMDDPTRGMKKEAATAGLYKWAYIDQDFPRLQLFTIKEILEGKKIDFAGSQANVTLRRAPRARERDAENMTLRQGVAEGPPPRSSKRGSH